MSMLSPNPNNDNTLHHIEPTSTMSTGVTSPSRILQLSMLVVMKGVQMYIQKVLDECRVHIHIEYFNIIFYITIPLTTLKTSLELVRNWSEPQLVQTSLETAKNHRRSL